jgi:hypothetical protein
MDYTKLLRSLLTALFMTALVLAFSGCADTPLPTTDGVLPPYPEHNDAIQTVAAPTTTPDRETVSPTPQPTSTPIVMTYNLGEEIITQEWFPAGDRFRDMPVRLEGVIGAPAAGADLPVVLILHGNHPGCPLNEFSVDAWPCAVEDEEPNYQGFDYLVGELATRGYLALSININGEYTFGFGEPQAGVRLKQIVDLHLEALAEASAGGANEFGLPLDGRVDLSRMTWIGHSQGGELGAMLIRDNKLHQEDGALAAGYGPVRGLLQIAPPVAHVQPAPLADLPLAVILPSCDADVIGLDGGYFFEAARDDRARRSVATSVYLSGANHNSFNTVRPPDVLREDLHPECASEFRLSPDEQRAFLVDYAAEFLHLALGPTASAGEAMSQLGLIADQPAPRQLFGQEAAPTYSGDTSQELLLLRPFTESEIGENLLGGATTMQGLTAVFCPPGFFMIGDNPALQACRRNTVNQPGFPTQLALSWDGPGAALSLALPPVQQDIADYDALRLRAALDPLAVQNTPGATLSFSARLRDNAGAEATAVVELPFPAGIRQPDDLFEEGLFSGDVILQDVRLPLAAFPGVDLTQLNEISLVFDQQTTGALFLSDVGLLQAQVFAGEHSTLLSNANGALNPLRAVGRFNGRADCTAVLINSGGGPSTPAYALTNSHCVQQSDDTSATLSDQPAADMRIIFNYFADTTEEHISVPVATVAYSSIKGRDVAVVELAATLGALAYQEVRPLPITATPLEGEAQVQVVGAPQGGFDAASAYLRHERCTASRAAGLPDAAAVYAVDCRDISGGSAGSPVFAGEAEELFALISAKGAATPVDGLRECFAADGRFDLAQPLCPLAS